MYFYYIKDNAIDSGPFLLTSSAAKCCYLEAFNEHCGNVDTVATDKLVSGGILPEFRPTLAEGKQYNNQRTVYADRVEVGVEDIPPSEPENAEPNLGYGSPSLVDSVPVDAAVGVVYDLTITGAETPPIIGTIADQNFLASAGVPAFPFAINDFQDVDSVELSALSSNTTFLPINKIILTKNGVAPTLEILPLAGSGTALATVTGTNLYGFTAQSSFTVHAGAQLFTITTSAGANGSITPTINNAVEGATYVITATADEGYEAVTLTVDGVPMAYLSEWTFNNISANHTVDVAFDVVAPALVMSTFVCEATSTDSIIAISEITSANAVGTVLYQVSESATPDGGGTWQSAEAWIAAGFNTGRGGVYTATLYCHATDDRDDYAPPITDTCDVDAPLTAFDELASFLFALDGSDLSTMFTTVDGATHPTTGGDNVSEWQSVGGTYQFEKPEAATAPTLASDSVGIECLNSPLRRMTPFISNSTAFTIYVAVKASAQDGVNYIFAQTNSSGPAGRFGVLTHATVFSKPRFFINTSGGTAAIDCTQTAFDSTDRILCASFNGTNQIKMSVDKNAFETAAVSGTWTPANSLTLIGALLDSAGNSPSVDFVGKIRAIAVYTAEADTTKRNRVIDFINSTIVP